MNITILCGILMSFLIGIGLWRGQAFYFSITLIFLFIAMVGFQPSAVRAGIMGALFLLAQKTGRQPALARAMVFAAALMVLSNPLLLRNDVGFQLSFLAMMGMVYFALPLERWLRFLPQEKFINLRSILATTLSAQIFTLPIIIYNFGRISLVAPLTNILVLPIISLLMVLGLVCVLSGLLWGTLGWLFALPCWLLLAYLMKIIDLFSRPWAAKTIENVHWLWLVISYLLISLAARWLFLRQKLSFLQT